MNEILFSSKSEEWATPNNTYEKLNKIYNFNLDPASTDLNCKCEYHFTKREDGLKQSWKGYRVFCNPPYGKQINEWVEKAYNESKDENTIIVMLLPARTDTKWFHDFIYKKAEIEFLKGRLKFGNSKNSAPFPSMLVYYNVKGEKNV